MALTQVPQGMLGTPIAGTGPAFSVYPNASQTISNVTFTKVAFNAENFDTNGNFDTTNYRFTPTVAGYYQINASIGLQATSNATVMICSIYKNGTEFRRADNRFSSTMSQGSAVVSDVIYMNGSTDYLEVDAYVSGAGTINILGTNIYSLFSGALVRAA